MLRLLSLVLFLFPVVALAQASAPSPMTDAESLDALLKGLGGVQGAGALGIAIFVTQVLVYLGKLTFVSNLLGKWQLLIVTGVSLVSTVLVGKAAGMTWVAALVSGPVVAAAQVFGHQIWDKFGPQPKNPAVLQ